MEIKRKRGRPKGTKYQVGLEVRRRQAVQLKVVGYTYEEIAKATGYASPGAAYNAVMLQLQKERSSSVEDLRSVEGRRLDELSKILWPLCLTADIGAIDAYLRLMNRRAKLFGLDLTLPPSTTIEGNVFLVKVEGREARPLKELGDDELSIYIQELRQLAGPEDSASINVTVEGEVTELP